VIAIVRPLPDIAYHVEGADPVSGKRADRSGLPASYRLRQARQLALFVPMALPEK
jgi:hypothetical protein